MQKTKSSFERTSIAINDAWDWYWCGQTPAFSVENFSTNSQDFSHCLESTQFVLQKNWCPPKTGFTIFSTQIVHERQVFFHMKWWRLICKFTTSTTYINFPPSDRCLQKPGSVQSIVHCTALQPLVPKGWYFSE